MRRLVIVTLAALLALATFATPVAACDPSDPGFPPGFTC